MNLNLEENMVKMSVVNNETLSEYEKLFSISYCKNLQFTFREEETIMFCPQTDGLHQHKIVLPNKFFAGTPLDSGEKSISEGENQSEVCIPANFSSYKLFPPDTFYENTLISGPRFDLLSPEITGWRPFINSGGNQLIFIDKDDYILLFETPDEDKWPAVIFPTALIHPYFYTAGTTSEEVEIRYA